MQIFKKIVIVLGYSILTAALGAYFWFAGGLVKEKYSSIQLRRINIVITDSAVNRFVNREMITNLLKLEGVSITETKLRHLNLFDIEKQLKFRYNIKRAEASKNMRGELNIEVEQRRPLLRLECRDGGFYIDDEAYIFPLDTVYTADVPVVTGNIPLTLFADFKGTVKENREWADAIMKIGEHISREDLWNAMIEQIDIDSNGDLHFTPRVGKQDIIFGPADNIEEKFTKLSAFYNDIAPDKGWEKYSEINLKFDRQIVCKLNKSFVKQNDTLKRAEN